MLIAKDFLRRQVVIKIRASILLRMVKVFQAFKNTFKVIYIKT